MLYSFYEYKSNIITQAWVYLMINLAKPRVFVGKSKMIYDRPSEMVPVPFFLLVGCFFLQLQASKTYSGISIQYATC